VAGFLWTTANLASATKHGVTVAEEGDTFLVFPARFLTAAEKRRYRQRTKR
jgi:hypothetical protein